MSRHTITAEIDVSFQLSGAPEDEHETARPTFEICFDFHPGHPARIHYDENDYPGEGDSLELVSAKVTDGDGISLDQDQIDQRATDWLDDKGYDAACKLAREDGR